MGLLGEATYLLLLHSEMAQKAAKLSIMMPKPPMKMPNSAMFSISTSLCRCRRPSQAAVVSGPGANASLSIGMTTQGSGGFKRRRSLGVESHRVPLLGAGRVRQ
jgi:hypothetical protein